MTDFVAKVSLLRTAEPLESDDQLSSMSLCWDGCVYQEWMKRKKRNRYHREVSMLLRYLS